MLITSLVASGHGLVMFSAATPWYPIYTQSTGIFGRSAFDDQQLAAAVLALPPVSVDLVAFLWVILMWIRQEEREIEIHRGPAQHPTA